MADTLNGNRPFEHEVFNAKRMVQPDLFRLEMRGQKHKWMSPRGFIAGSRDMRSSPAPAAVDPRAKTRTSINLRNSRVGGLTDVPLDKTASNLAAGKTIEPAHSFGTTLQEPSAMQASKSGLRFPSIDNEPATASLYQASKTTLGYNQANTHEPYQKVNVLGQRGLGGNQALKKIQAEYRAKQNRSTVV